MVAAAKGIRVMFQHVPRERNQCADWLSKKALQEKADGEVAQSELQEHNLERSEDLIAILADRQDSGPACVYCKSPVAPDSPSLQCWGCEAHAHRGCEKRSRRVPYGPWHCQRCVSLHQKRKTRDITLDRDLLRYIVSGRVPTEATAHARVARHARYVQVDRDGSVWLVGDVRVPRRVPPMRDRRRILEDTFRGLGHPSG